MSDWCWYCMRCDRDLGPMAGKHLSQCPECGCKSAYCTHAKQLRLEVL